MTEPPRPPGEGYSGGTPPPDPTAPPPPPPYPNPGEASPGYASSPPPGTGAAPPTSGGPFAAPGSYPPPGNYPPPGAYPPPGGQPAGYPAGGYGGPTGGYGGPPPAGFPTNDDRTWALIAHFGGAAGAFLGAGTAGWIAPLVALLAKGNQSPTVRAHAVSALNFQLVWAIVALVGYVLFCAIIGFAIVPVAVLVGGIFGIIAGVKANNGEQYRYPMTISLVK